jgi:hypothetical protein
MAIAVRSTHIFSVIWMYRIGPDFFQSVSIFQIDELPSSLNAPADPRQRKVTPPMSRESLQDEPVLDEEIVEQNFELMEERFPEIIVDEWKSGTIPLIEELIASGASLDDGDLRAKAHKAAGSTLQLGGHQLGTALRTVSHFVQSGSRDLALEILQDVRGYYDAFLNAMKE